MYHPEHSINEELVKLFHKTGCKGKPYGLDRNPDAMQREKRMFKQGEIDQIERGLMEIKQKSDKYDKLGKPTDYKQFSEMCNGYSVSATGITKTEKMSNPPICLPTAPYELSKREDN